MVKLELDHNRINDELQDRIQEELANNKGIVKKIMPALGGVRTNNEL